MAKVKDPAEKLKIYEKCMNDDYIQKMQGNRNSYKPLKSKNEIFKIVSSIVDGCTHEHGKKDKSVDKVDLDKELLENQNASLNTSMVSDNLKST